MGNICTSTTSKVAKISDAGLQVDSSDEANPMYFLCTQKGVILDSNEQVERELLYSKADIRDKFIGMLMSPFISYLHKKVFLKRLKSSTGLEHSRILFKLKDLTNKRPFIVYDLHGLPVYVSVHIALHTAAEISALYKELHIKSDYDFSSLKKDEKFVMLQINKILSKKSVAKLETIMKVNTAMTSKSDMLYMMSKSVTEEMSHTFRLTTNSVVVICIDIMDSTQMLMEKGPHHMASISAQFYKDVIDTIKNQFYPFIYIYEIVGDSFMFIVNADWTYNISPFCATISVYFIKNLINQVRDYISIRAGFSYGIIS